MATAPDTTTAKSTNPVSPPTTIEDCVDELERLDPRVALRRQFHEALRSRMHDHIDKDGSYFSYMFLDKLLNSTKKCLLCGAKESGKLPDSDMSLELFVAETGVVGRQNLECTKCKRLYMVTSCGSADEIPSDSRLTIQGMEIRYYCKRITHFEVLHDLMEMLHIAATDDDKLRREKHAEVADFMLRNARRVCEEWCKAEYVELRLKKYLRLREETLLTTYNPTFTPECTDEYKEMYEMMANSFRQNRRKVLLLLELMKESLVDNPTRPSFMMWVSIAMMHSENYHEFKAMYDPRSFMRVDSTEYQALKDRYLALDVPLGVKKIPVVFMLFEIPRFYHFVDFLSRRLGKKKPRSFLTDADQANLAIAIDESKGLGIKRKPKSGKLVSPEAHLDFLTRQEELEREMLFQSCREKEKKKEKAKAKSKRRAASATPTPVVNPPDPRYLAVIPTPQEAGPRPVCMSKDDFKSMLYDHLKANEASVASGRIPGLPANFPPIPPADTQPTPKYVKYSSLQLPLPPIPPPRVRPPQPSQPAITSGSSSGKKSKKEAKKAKKNKQPGPFEDPTKTVLVAQIDSEILRAQGYTLSEEGRMSSVVASRNGIVEYILEGYPNIDEVKAYLSMMYKDLHDQIAEEDEKVPGTATKPSKGDTPLSTPDSSSTSDLSSSEASSGTAGTKKKRRKKKRKNGSATDDSDVVGAKEDSSSPPAASTASSDPTNPKGSESGKALLGDLQQAGGISNSTLREMSANSDFSSVLNSSDAGGVAVGRKDTNADSNGMYSTTGERQKGDKDGDTAKKPIELTFDPKGKPDNALDSPSIAKPSPLSSDVGGRGGKSKKVAASKKAPVDKSFGDLAIDVGKPPTDPTVALTRNDPSVSGAAQGDTPPEEDEGLSKANTEEAGEEQSASSGESDGDSTGLEGDASRSKKTARDKFKTCENCQLVINERIQVCAGCKKVAYCNYRCQKAHWKVHKKTCSYALKKDAKDRTG